MNTKTRSSGTTRSRTAPRASSTAKTAPSKQAGETTRLRRAAAAAAPTPVVSAPAMSAWRNPLMRSLKGRLLLVGMVASVATCFPLLLADAGDDTPISFPQATTPAKVLPIAIPDVTATPATLLPPATATIALATPTTAAPANPFGTGAVVAPVAPVTNESNPFSLPAVTPAGPAASLAPASDNPFIVPATPKDLPATDAAPFALATAGAAATPVQVANIPADVDVTALRYYATQGDMARVDAETKRLKSLYPTWEPPRDLFAKPSTIDEQPLWDLFAAGNYAVERQRIDELMAANPGWTPSDDLMTKLGDAEARAAMKLAFDLGNWEQVIAVAQGRNSVLVCSQIEALWQLGEALAHTQDYARAFDTYKYVLTTCVDPKDRLSTVQKAALVLPPVGTSALVMLGRPQADGTSEFMSIGFDDLRKRMVGTINDRFGADPVTPDEVERFVNFVRVKRDPNDIALVGWYYYAQKQWDTAAAWFALGSKTKADEKFLEGQILSLRAGNNAADAMELALDVRDRSPELGQQYIEMVSQILSDPLTTRSLPKTDLKDFENFVMEHESALGAQAIGWRYIEDDNLDRAVDWFDRSMEWEVTEGGVLGLAVVASRLKHNKTLAALKAEYGDAFIELDDFKTYGKQAREDRSASVRAARPPQVKCTTTVKGTQALLSAFICDTES